MASDRERQSLHAPFLEIISGARKGFFATLSRAILAGLEVIYSAVISLRNWTFEQQIIKSNQLPIPVISVGNLTAGGTGKTPIVLFLAEWLFSMGHRPAIVMRGYGAKVDLSKSHLVSDGSGHQLSISEAGDEATQLVKKMPGLPVWIGANRFTSGLEAIKKNKADVILMDDGFQHRKLFRDVDIVVIDALQPWGYCHVLPRGLLREKVTGLQRADIAVITRSDLLPEVELNRLKAKIQKHSPEIPIFETAHEPRKVIDLSGQDVISLSECQGKKVHLFCGLGNPQGFFQTARNAGFSVTGQTAFPDHHSYEENEIQSLCDQARDEGAIALLTTEKDGVKLENFVNCSLPIWQLTIEVSFGNAEEHLKNVIMKKCYFDGLKGEK